MQRIWVDFATNLGRLCNEFGDTISKLFSMNILEAPFLAYLYFSSLSNDIKLKAIGQKHDWTMIFCPIERLIGILQPCHPYTPESTFFSCKPFEPCPGRSLCQWLPSMPCMIFSHSFIIESNQSLVITGFYSKIYSNSW